MDMGKKKKNKKKGEAKIKKHASGVEDRVKKIAQIQLPEENPHYLDNEKNIDKFLKFGMMRNKYKGTIKNQRRAKHAHGK